MTGHRHSDSKDQAAQSIYTVINGRTFTSHATTYALPADYEEHRRLDTQHFSLALSLDGLFPFRDLITPLLQKGQLKGSPRILDIGTGSGRWALEIANAHPWAEVLGTDLVPQNFPSGENVHSNCRFEIYDANLPMEQYSDTFSLVHARLVGGGLKDSRAFFHHIARVLESGGILLMVTNDQQLRDENLEPFPFVEPGEPRFTWMQYIVGQAFQAMWRRGAKSVHYQLWWEDWLKMDGAYSGVRAEHIDIPIGVWKEGLSEREALAATLFRDNVLQAYEAYRQLFLAVGHREQDVDFWIQEGTKELQEMRIHTYVRFLYLAAVRSSSPWETNPTPSSSDPFDLTAKTSIVGIDVT